MNDSKKTMTLNLTDAEMRVVEDLAKKKELTKTAVIRQAIRLYQMIETSALSRLNIRVHQIGFAR